MNQNISLWTVVRNTKLTELAAASSSVGDLIGKLQLEGNRNPDGCRFLILPDGESHVADSEENAPFAAPECLDWIINSTVADYIKKSTLPTELQEEACRAVLYPLNRHITQLIKAYAAYYTSEALRSTMLDKIQPGTNHEELTADEAEIVQRILQAIRDWGEKYKIKPFDVCDVFLSDAFPGNIDDSKDVRAYERFSETKKAHARAQVIRLMLWTTLRFSKI